MKHKERPILMNPAMTVATLDGLKTQTRRIVKPQPNGQNRLPTKRNTWMNVGDPRISELCPYGRPGDRLYIRERTRLFEVDDGSYSVSGMVHGQKVKFKYEADGQVSDWLDYPTRLAMLHVGNCVSNGVYKEAARLWLEITNVRVERLQDVSEDDAAKEGCNLEWYADNAGEENLWPCPKCQGFQVYGALGPNMGVTEVDCQECDTSKKMFQHLWESINGPGSWAQNPWVWVIEFKRV